jgi:hypothetical protein
MLEYMGLEGGKPLLGPSHRRRLHRQLHELAHHGPAGRGLRAQGPKVKAPRVMVVPGSHIVKDQAEAEGLHTIFKDAGCEWREPGCSMCLAMNGDELKPGQYCVSTSNRNFEGRQGKGGRTPSGQPADRRGVRHRGQGRRRQEIPLMDPITVFTGKSVGIPIANIDTDQITPGAVPEGHREEAGRRPSSPTGASTPTGPRRRTSR